MDTNPREPVRPPPKSNELNGKLPLTGHSIMDDLCWQLLRTD